MGRIFNSINNEQKVEVFEAVEDSLSLNIQAVGEVIPKQVFNGFVSYPGKISEIYVTEGQRVVKGQQLFKMEAADTSLQENLEAAAAAADAYTTKINDPELLAALALAQSYGIDYEEFMNIYLQSESVQTSLDLYGETLPGANELITASEISGEVLSVDVQQGNYANAGQSR
jgi:multidrug efflux pump subunit AcrA (membrane-fusion protein)